MHRLRQTMIVAWALVAVVTCRAETPSPSAPSLPEDLVHDFQDRQRCNLLNGCAPEDRLAALGRDYAGAACTFYATTAADADRYYRSRVLAALGRVGGPEAVACLRRALREGRWLDQAVAAFALGELRAMDAVPELEAALSSSMRSGGLALEAGARAALAQLGRPVELAPLWAHLAAVETELANWPMLRFVVQAARALKARDQAPAIARLLRHPDYYLRREALVSLAALGDPATVEAVAAALDDPLPGIRKGAAAALSALVPGSRRSTVDDWKAWRASRGGRSP